MSLSCLCNDDVDYGITYWCWDSDYSTLQTNRRKRCSSCGALIDLGAIVLRSSRYRLPETDIEERIHGDEVPLADGFTCERCADIFFSLEELGFCVYPGENMNSLLKEYQQTYGKQATEAE